ncbi:MAG: wax ester/triacylglycerol synthase family O-acyltransferase [Acidimicrobiia bacterium]|jgi:WS/DGAT/MGAT family acyltransferase
MSWKRLSGGDLAMLWPDDLGWPQDIGVLAILDGERLADPTAGYRIGELQDRIASRLDFLPRFRQRLHRPAFGQGQPYWADDPSFDIARHVRVRTLPKPGDESQLLEACEQLRRQRFDMAHPLWEFWFLNGLPDGRVGLFIKLHHTVADGAAGMSALAVFLDASPDQTPPALSTWNPEPGPTRLELIQDNLTHHWKRLQQALKALLHPGALLRRVRMAATEVRRILGEAKAPKTSLNRRIGDRRRLALVRSELDTFKEIARSADGTVNDVLLDVVAGGLRDLLAGRGEPVGDVLPRAIVPIAGGLDAESGNQTISGLLVQLPIGDSDAHHRLNAIAAETTVRKRNPLSYDEAGILNSPTMQRISARLAGRQRVSNIYVANIPGPPMDLYLGSARILELFPIVPLIGNTAIGVGALSYAGNFNLTVVADHDACPDLDVFVEGLRNTLNCL